MGTTDASPIRDRPAPLEVSLLTTVVQLIYNVVSTTGAAGALYTAAVATATAAAVFAPCPERRRDARETLKILLRQSFHRH